MGLKSLPEAISKRGVSQSLRRSKQINKTIYLFEDNEAGGDGGVFTTRSLEHDSVLKLLDISPDGPVFELGPISLVINYNTHHSLQETQTSNSLKILQLVLPGRVEHNCEPILKTVKPN